MSSFGDVFCEGLRHPSNEGYLRNKDLSARSQILRGHLSLINEDIFLSPSGFHYKVLVNSYLWICVRTVHVCRKI